MLVMNDLLKRLVLLVSIGIGASGCGDVAGPQPCEDTPSDHCWRLLGLRSTWVTAIATVDRQIFVGTHSDGVFRHDGKAWTPLGLDHAIISDIVPLAERGKLLVGVDAFADEQTTAAIYASTNGGVTWAAADGGLAQRRANRAWAQSLSSDPTNPDRVFWASDYKILRSPDAATSWDFVYGNESRAGGGWMPAIAVSPHGDGRVVVGGQSGLFTPLIFVSQDTGQTWNIVHPSPTYEYTIYRLLFDGVTTRIYAAADFGVMVSDDDGETWRYTLLLSRAGSVHGLAFFAGALYAASLENLRPGAGASDPPLSELGFYRSLDHGETWTSLATPARAAGADVMIADGSRRLLIGTRSGLWQVDDPTASQSRNP